MEIGIVPTRSKSTRNGQGNSPDLNPIENVWGQVKVGIAQNSAEEAIHGGGTCRNPDQNLVVNLCRYRLRLDLSVGREGVIKNLQNG
jgi:hypothetical protein